MSMMSFLRAFVKKRRKLRFARKLLVVSWGWLAFKRTGRTPLQAYYAMVYAFCYTSGRFNDWVSALISLGRKIEIRLPVQGVLGSLGQDEVNGIVAELHDKGYAVFPSIVPADTCERLMSFALTTKACVRRMDDEQRSEELMALYNPDQRPLAVRYDYRVQDLLDCEDVQALLADETLLAVVQKYLNAAPIFDIVTMWWHTNYHDKPDSQAAQLYHFDLDRIKWLKVFFYLTDVGAGDGPHSFISESHKTNGIPQDFLKRGYARLGDDDVLQHYGKDREIVFTGPRGTIILEDTRGLHKGNVVVPQGNARLILQFELSNSLFGAELNTGELRDVKSPALRLAMEKHKKTYELYRKS